MAKQKVAEWEWIVSILLAGLSGAIIWTNESVDLFAKLGFSINPGLAFFILVIFFDIGLSWILVLFLRHKELI